MTTPAAPLDQPLYGATFGQAVQRFFTKGLTFSGRASRSEFWWAMLLSALVWIVAGGAVGAIHAANGASGSPAETPGGLILLVVLFLWILVTLIPSISIHVRRLHDIDLSGWWYLLALVPYLGSLILFVMALLPSKPAGARFDRPPGA